MEVVQNIEANETNDIIDIALTNPIPDNTIGYFIDMPELTGVLNLEWS